MQSSAVFDPEEFEYVPRGQFAGQADPAGQ